MILIRLFVIAALLLVLMGQITAAHAGFNEGLKAYNASDFRGALRQFMPLAKGGNGRAQMLVGTMYLDGRGVRKNQTAAYKWILRAADQGQFQAQSYVAYLYEKGLGTKTDSTRAHMWLGIAEQRGDLIAGLNRARIAEKLSASQLETAKHLARDWIKKH